MLKHSQNLIKKSLATINLNSKKSVKSNYKKSFTTEYLLKNNNYNNYLSHKINILHNRKPNYRFYN